MPQSSGMASTSFASCGPPTREARLQAPYAELGGCALLSHGSFFTIQITKGIRLGHESHLVIRPTRTLGDVAVQLSSPRNTQNPELQNGQLSTFLSCSCWTMFMLTFLCEP